MSLKNAEFGNEATSDELSRSDIERRIPAVDSYK